MHYTTTCRSETCTAGAAPESLTRSRPFAIRNPGWGTLATPLIQCQQRGPGYLHRYCSCYHPSHRVEVLVQHGNSSVATMPARGLHLHCLRLLHTVYDGDDKQNGVAERDMNDESTGLCVAASPRRPRSKFSDDPDNLRHGAAETRNRPWASRKKLREAFL